MIKENINTLAEFKRKLAIGKNVHTLFHREIIGRDAKGDIIHKTIDRGAREVSILQTNCFALKTEKNGEIVNSYCEYPKASKVTIEDNNLHIYEEDRNGNKFLVLTYSILA